MYLYNINEEELPAATTETGGTPPRGAGDSENMCRQQLIILHKNVWGLLSEDRFEELARDVSKLEWDIILLNETWRLPPDELFQRILLQINESKRGMFEEKYHECKHPACPLQTRSAFIHVLKRVAESFMSFLRAMLSDSVAIEPVAAAEAAAQAAAQAAAIVAAEVSKIVTATASRGLAVQNPIPHGKKWITNGGSRFRWCNEEEAV